MQRVHEVDGALVRGAACVAFVGAMLVAGAVGITQERPHSGTLVVVADASKPLTLKLADLQTMPRTSITVKQPDGRGVTHEGVLI